MLHDGRWKRFPLRLDGGHRYDLVQLPFDRLYLALNLFQPSLNPLWTHAEGLDPVEYHAQDEDGDPEDNESHGERVALTVLSESHRKHNDADHEEHEPVGVSTYPPAHRSEWYRDTPIYADLTPLRRVGLGASDHERE